MITMGCGDINLLNDQIHMHYTEEKAKKDVSDSAKHQDN